MLWLALPAAAHALLHTLVFVVDRIMLGAHGKASLAAMQVAGVIEWTVFSVFSAFLVGTLAVVGRHVGAGDAKRAAAAARATLGIAVAVGLVVSVLSVALVPLAARLFPAGDSLVASEGASYMQVALAGSPLLFVAVSLTTILQASGDTRTPLLVACAVNVLHVGLARILVLGGLSVPAFGAGGAAASTVISFGVEAVVSFLILVRRRQPFSIFERGGGARKELSDVTRLGIVAMGERVVVHAGYLGFVVLITRLGSAAMAANQALISIESVGFLTADGFGVAAATLVAQKLGASNAEEAKRAAHLSAGIAIAVLAAFALAIYGSAPYVLPRFTTDPEVVRTALVAVPVLAFSEPFLACGAVLAQAVRGAGKTRIAFLVSALTAATVRVGATWVFTVPLGLGLRGVWLGSTCDWVVRAVLLGLLVTGGRSRLVFSERRSTSAPA